MKIFLACCAALLQILCHGLPKLVYSYLTFVPTLLNGLSFYFFWQGILLVLIFGNGLLAAVVIQASNFLAGDGKDQVLREPLKATVCCFVYYCVFRVLGFWIGAMWRTMLEISSDLPSLRREMVAGQGKQRIDLTPVAFLLGNKKKSICRRRTLLLSPWLLIIAILSFMEFARIYCARLEGGGQDVCAFFDPQARANRMLRFTMGVIIAQLLQAWLALFPRWHEVLAGTQQGEQSTGQSILKVVALFCFAAAMMFLAWQLVSLLRGPTLGLEYYIGPRYDCGLLMLAVCWVLASSALIVKDEQSITDSGFSMRVLNDRKSWSDFTSQCKGTLWSCQLVHALHGFLSRGIGHTISDLVTINILYPMICCLLWSSVSVIMTLASHARKARAEMKVIVVLGGLALIAVAWWLCMCVRGQEEQSLLMVFFVWLYLSTGGYQVLEIVVRAVKSWRKSCARAQSAVTKDAHLTRLDMPQFQIAAALLRLFFLASLIFCSILGFCAVAAIVQQYKGAYGADMVKWDLLPNGIQINHGGASVLTLGWANSERHEQTRNVLAPGQEAKYMVCGQTWHGLQLLDYALLSELPYMLDTEENNLPSLLRHLTPHLNLTIRNSSTGRRPWMELELGTKSGPSVSIMVVSGTLLDRIADYLEDIRMWTEPVVLQILHTVIPTSRFWPRETTALLIGGQLRAMAGLGISEEWQYQEILDHVRQMPADRPVAITGHSLGGGIALVVGALTGRTAVAIQPPGAYHSLAKHQAGDWQQGGERRSAEGSEVLHQKSVSLVVEGDLVSNFDLHGGLVQTIGCDHSEKSFTLGCHALGGAVCHLMRNCGDQAGRFAQCQHQFSVALPTLKEVQGFWSFAQQGWVSAAGVLWTQANMQRVLLVSFILSALVASWNRVPRYQAETGSDTLET